MELAASQKFLARIFTDSQLRTRFYADPVAVGSEFGLSPEGARALAALPEEQVHEFSKSVRRQRRDAVSRLLPTSVKCLGPAFGEAFRDYVIVNALPAEAHAWRDALGFNRFFQSWAASHRVPRWQRELMAYESDRLEFTHSRSRLDWRFSFFPGHRTARRIAAGDVPTNVWPVPGLRVFWRWRADAGMHEKCF